MEVSRKVDHVEFGTEIEIQTKLLVHKNMYKTLQGLQDKSIEAVKEFKEAVKYEDVPHIDRINFYCQSAALNAKNIGIIMGSSTGTVTAVGAIAGAIIGSPTPVGPIFGGLIGGGVGAFAGAGIGLGICIGTNQFYREDCVKFALRKHPEYDRARETATKKQWEVMVKFVGLYKKKIKQKDPMLTVDIRRLNCIFSRGLPEVPVFSPHDTKRLHAYEKKHIEEWLDSVEHHIAAAKFLNRSDAEIEEIKLTADLFRGPYFTKDQLQYDTKYVAKMIRGLQRFHQNMIDDVNNGAEDENLTKISRDLITHYSRSYRVASRSLVDQMQDDLVKTGSTTRQSQIICNAFRDQYVLQKEPSAEETEEIIKEEKFLIGKHFINELVHETYIKKTFGLGDL